MILNIGQRWLYHSTNREDSFICEILPSNKYVILQRINGMFQAKESYTCPANMADNIKNWIYLEGQDKPI